MHNFGCLFCSFVWLALQATHYELLNVPENASSVDIKNAYHREAKKLHPDRNPDPQATRSFQDLNAAFSTLSDDALRKIYDDFLHPEHAQDIEASCTCISITLLKKWTIFFFAPCIEVLREP